MMRNIVFLKPVLNRKVFRNVCRTRRSASFNKIIRIGPWHSFNSIHFIYPESIPREFVNLFLIIEQRFLDSVSALLESYYAEKNEVTRIRQKSADLRKIVQTALERTVKKYDLQLAQMKDTEKKDKYRIWGELITAYGYNVPEGSKSMEALNYYDNQQITIPLDPTLAAMENAKKYFDKYCKMKRTFEALEDLTAQVKAEIDHLESIATSLDIALKESDLVQIKEELIESSSIQKYQSADEIKENAINNADVDEAASMVGRETDNAINKAADSTKTAENAPDKSGDSQGDEQDDGQAEKETAETSVEVEPEAQMDGLSFNEASVIKWPVEGEVLLPFPHRFQGLS